MRHSGRQLSWLALTTLGLGCGNPLPAAEAPSPYTTATPGQVPASPEVEPSGPQTLSPQPTEVADPADRALTELCRRPDRALQNVALELAQREAEGASELDVAQITFALRRQGSPYVWPRAWLREDAEGRRDVALKNMQTWLASFNDGGERRCGVASVRKGNGREVIAAVAIDALADLMPLPVRARVSRWINVEAKLLVPATQAKVVILGPRGTPQPIPTSFSGDRVQARFVLDQRGPYLVQLLVNVGAGPRPVLESLVYADVEPPTAYQALPAPGEEASIDGLDVAVALERMVNSARAAERMRPLRRLADLDRIAQEHAEAMRRERRLAHDVGQGDPKSRVEALGLGVQAAGENVAHAADIRKAHRALWSSPSHRGNVLHPRFDVIGIGVAVDNDGSVWVCEVFAQLP